MAWFLLSLLRMRSGSDMENRIMKAIVVCGFLTGCGEVGADPPRFTDDVEAAVQIQFATGQGCSGSILSEHWILTAGHCLKAAISAGSDPDNDRVVIFEQVSGERTIIYEGPAELVIHPDYKGLGHLAHRWHDIGLIALRDGTLDAGSRARLGGTVRSFETVDSAGAELFAVGFGHSPDPDTGRCMKKGGVKKRYDGFLFREFEGPFLGNAFSVRLEGRTEALCPGDSGAPLMFDTDEGPHVFAVFGGRARGNAVFHGTLVGPKIGWFESASSKTWMPLECVEIAWDSWECFE